MAILSLCVPREISRILSGVDLGLGEKVDASGMHITVCYLGKDLAVERVASMLTPIFEIVSQTRPFTVSTSRVTTFPANPDDGVPIIAMIDSNELQDFRGRLVKALTEAVPDFPKDKYFPYAPHVTLAYSKDPLVDADNAVDKQIPTVEWGVGELTLWGGDMGDERFFVTFPLSVVQTRAAMYKAIVRVASMNPVRANDEPDPAYVLFKSLGEHPSEKAQALLEYVEVAKAMDEAHDAKDLRLFSSLAALPYLALSHKQLQQLMLLVQKYKPHLSQLPELKRKKEEADSIQAEKAQQEYQRRRDEEALVLEEEGRKLTKAGWELDGKTWEYSPSIEGAYMEHYKAKITLSAKKVRISVIRGYATVASNSRNL